MNTVRAVCQTLQRWLVRSALIVATLSLAIMLGLSLAQILARNLLHTGFAEADDAIRGLVMWVVFAGASIAVHSQRHIRVDILNLVMPAAWLRALHGPLQLFASAICVLLAQAAARFWWEEWQNAAPPDQFSTALLVIFPVGFAVLALDFLVSAGAGADPTARAA
jgi:TRAP-type C4-dicarboxylate transport system permease small subunit